MLVCSVEDIVFAKGGGRASLPVIFWDPSSKGGCVGLYLAGLWPVEWCGDRREESRLKEDVVRGWYLQVGLDGLLEGPLVGTDDLGDLLATLEEHESGHGTDAQLLSDVGDLVDVDLVKVHLLLVRVGLAELGDLGGDHLTRAAPGGEAVQDDQTVGWGLDDGGVEGGFAVDRVNTVLLRGASSGGGATSLLLAQLGLVVGNVLSKIVDDHFVGRGGESVWDR